MADFEVKQGDLEPTPAIQLVDTAGAAQILSTATSVLFRMADSLNRIEVFSREATIDDAVAGQLSYTWQAGDTDVPGVYYAEFVVMWPGGRPQTYPADGYLTVLVSPKL